MGEAFTARNMLAFPVLDRNGAVIAIIEVADKKNMGDFKPHDEEVLRAFCGQLSAILARKATDALFANLHSSLDESSKNMLEQYKNPTGLSTDASGLSRSHCAYVTKRQRRRNGIAGRKE